MDYAATFRISASGMALEKTRLEIASVNIANMNQAGRSADSVFKPLKLVAQAVPFPFAGHFDHVRAGGVQMAGAVPVETAPRLVHEPGHPYANAQGMVAYPGVDHTAEMLNLNIALRAYEANVVALNAGRTMAARTLDIGGQNGA
jgi:flagellar basal-body rod protein FlgC